MGAQKPLSSLAEAGQRQTIGGSMVYLSRLSGHLQVIPRKFRGHASGAVSLLLLVSMAAIMGHAQGQAAPAQPAPGQPATAQESTVELMHPPSLDQPGAPITITLQDAIGRAQKNDAQFLAANTDAKSAHEDRVQAKAALLPSLSTRLE